LIAKVGEADANALLSDLSGSAELMASLGPVVGLARLARGEMTREAYLAAYGHRGPHEMELSIPYPLEDPAWLDEQLAQHAREPVDAEALLDRRRAEAEAAWQRFAQSYPRQAGAMRKRLDKIGPAAIIRGPFDPFRWAADPHRRSDVFDARSAAASAGTGSSSHDRQGSLLTGHAGAAGIIEGMARVLRSPEEGGQLLAGEVLVAVTTNVGWTPLFPRAAAVVTDVGAPLSHAAIVARELGIPAVVGCVDATQRIQTGDRLRVDGGRGTVTILDRRNA
jgi:pyruvate,water dikinase